MADNPQTQQMITLDPVAAHYARTAEFFRNEALMMAAQLRDASATVAALQQSKKDAK